MILCSMNVFVVDLTPQKKRLLNSVDIFAYLLKSILGLSRLYDIPIKQLALFNASKHKCKSFLSFLRFYSMEYVTSDLPFLYLYVYSEDLIWSCPNVQLIVKYFQYS